MTNQKQSLSDVVTPEVVCILLFLLGSEASV